MSRKDNSQDVNDLEQFYARLNHGFRYGIVHRYDVFLQYINSWKSVRACMLVTQFVYGNECLDDNFHTESQGVMHARCLAASFLLALHRPSH